MSFYIFLLNLSILRINVFSKLHQKYGHFATSGAPLALFVSKILAFEFGQIFSHLRGALLNERGKIIMGLP